MDKAFRRILDLVCRYTALVTTILFVVFAVLVWTLLLGPSLEFTLSMLGLGVVTAFVEFAREPSI